MHGNGSGDPSGCPSPLEVEAADAAVDVQHLAAEREPRAPEALHRSEVDLLDRDTASCDFGVREPSIALDRQ